MLFCYVCTSCWVINLLYGVLLNLMYIEGEQITNLFATYMDCLPLHAPLCLDLPANSAWTWCFGKFFVLSTWTHFYLPIVFHPNFCWSISALCIWHNHICIMEIEQSHGCGQSATSISYHVTMLVDTSLWILWVEMVVLEFNLVLVVLTLVEKNPKNNLANQNCLVA